jgi:hypothetical protein
MVIVDKNMIHNPLKHHRISAIQCWDELLSGCKTLSCFIDRIEKYAKIIAQADTIEEIVGIYDKLDANCFKGDVTEIFAEYVLKRNGAEWGVYNYAPLSEEENDVGVDGTGVTPDGRIVTVQVKYGNYTEDLDNARRHLHTFHWTSKDQYGIDRDSKDQLFIFTLSGGIHWRTREVSFHKRLRFISQRESGGIYAPNNTNDIMPIYNRKTIAQNDLIFWQTFYSMVKGDKNEN